MGLRGGMNAGGLQPGGLRRIRAPFPDGRLIDSYEDGDLQEYQDNTASGGISEFDVVADGTTVHGDRSVWFGGSGYPKIMSQSGLENYPSQGDEFRYWVYVDAPVGSGSSQLGFYFGGQDLNNTYFVVFRAYNDEIRLYEKVGGASTSIADNSPVGITSGAWHEIIVQWDDGSTFGGVAGDFTVVVRDASGTEISRMTANSTEFTGGGVGWYGDNDTGDGFYFDKNYLPDEHLGGGGGGGGDTSDGTTIADFENTDLSMFVVAHEEDGQPWRFTRAQSDAEPIGGGVGYPGTVAQADADVTVTTDSELRDALAGATTGDIVYVTDYISTVGNGEVTIPSGVTLASDRGINGSNGELIEVGKRDLGITLRQGARLTGLQVRGPWPEDWSPDDKVGDDYHQKGILLADNDAEVDNCEIWGFGYSCLQGSHPNYTGTADNSHIHHNNIHHGIGEGWGYGMDTSTASNILLEYNRFAHCRHMIAGSGGSNNSYHARHNIVEEPNGGHVFDMHAHGDWVEIERNTVCAFDANIDEAPQHWSAYGPTDTAPAYAQRDVPYSYGHAYDNWFWNTKEPPASPQGWSEHAIIQAVADTYENMDWWNNHYNRLEWPSADQATADGRRCRDAGERALIYLGTGKRHQIHSVSGLPNYPSAGDTWRFFFRWEGRERLLAQVFFGVQHAAETYDYYELEIREDSLALELDQQNESDQRLGSLTHYWEPMVPYEIRIDWPADPATNGITATVTNWYSGTQVASFTADPDDTWLEGGIGLYGNTTAGFIVDDFEIVN